MYNNFVLNPPIIRAFSPGSVALVEHRSAMHISIIEFGAPDKYVLVERIAGH